jgi:hypothetical protein
VINVDTQTIYCVLYLDSAQGEPPTFVTVYTPNWCNRM